MHTITNTLQTATVTNAEFSTLAGVTSSVQTQLNDRSPKLLIANRQVASYPLVLSDADKLVEMNVGSANDLTVPTNASVAFPIGTQITEEE